jgi:hypothetical protein
VSAGAADGGAANGWAGAGGTKAHLGCATEEEVPQHVALFMVRQEFPVEGA